MTSILIVESNSPELVAAGRSNARPFLDTLTELDRSLDLRVTAPYEEPFSTDALAGIDGVVFSGSGVSWAADDPRAAPLDHAMRAAFELGVPVWGSCNGLLLAACILGGATAAASGGVERGVAKGIALTDAGGTHPMMSGRSARFEAVCIHRDEVSVLPTGAVLLAGNAHSWVQAFAYERDGVDFWGAQYHPEYTTRTLAAGLRHFDPEAAELAWLEAAPEDPEAAARLGTTPAALAMPTRATELVNWLAHLRERA